MAALVYADPLARLSLGQAGPTFTGNATRTVTFNNSTFSFTPGSLPSGTGRRSVDATGQIETLVAIAVAAVGLVLEFMVIFLWQGERNPPSQTGAGTGRP